ncbi:unnamed protein product (macronuclear) [Paramecium tetraurelia]|uniref:Uncharacterized protein n=1 Tax=Paramecium tetraurelia TaxID=5888 RepID=A0CST4_PARTE|nr:uncharacterized protein GSPATT00010123001 [Paramecium tetraurelia]CAK73851.1 unnamed protein product [Paramecium tetraurelia]|eukprot:XP_001441248.1 hypothetical protein (macronuclear) [Paramecium tetraurelia strain d4-2]
MGCAQIVNHTQEVHQPQLQRNQSKKTTLEQTKNDYDSPIIFPLTFPEGFGRYRKQQRNSTVKLKNTMKVEISLDSSRNTILKRRTTLNPYT